jgi:hypothetical protein
MRGHGSTGLYRDRRAHAYLRDALPTPTVAADFRHPRCGNGCGVESRARPAPFEPPWRLGGGCGNLSFASARRRLLPVSSPPPPDDPADDNRGGKNPKRDPAPLRAAGAPLVVRRGSGSGSSRDRSARRSHTRAGRGRSRDHRIRHSLGDRRCLSRGRRHGAGLRRRGHGDRGRRGGRRCCRPRRRGLLCLRRCRRRRAGDARKRRGDRGRDRAVIAAAAATSDGKANEHAKQRGCTSPCRRAPPFKAAEPGARSDHKPRR